MLEKEPNSHVYYLNLAYFDLPKTNPGFDLVVFHTSLLAERWDTTNFEELKSKFQKTNWIIDLYSVAFPQDEFYKANELDRFFSSLNVNFIFGLIPAYEFRKIYPNSSKFSSYFQVLPFYIEKKEIPKYYKSYENRDLDLVYRAWAAEPWLGQTARDKLNMLQVQDLLKEQLFKIDLSCSPDKQLENSDWLKLLANSKWTLVTPGGASISDPDGDLRNLYIKSRLPNKNIDDFDLAYKKLKFNEFDFSLDLSVITPRILEAAICGTALIAFPSRYNDKLLPGVHYFPLNRDFSNLNSLIEVLNDIEVWNYYQANLQKLIFQDSYFHLENFVLKFEKISSDFTLRNFKGVLLLRLRLYSYRLRDFFSKVSIFYRFSIISKILQKVKTILKF
jgi:hypothetical protein